MKNSSFIEFFIFFVFVAFIAAMMNMEADLEGGDTKEIDVTDIVDMTKDAGEKAENVTKKLKEPNMLLKSWKKLKKFRKIFKKLKMLRKS